MSGDVVHAHEQAAPDRRTAPVATWYMHSDGPDCWCGPSVTNCGGVQNVGHTGTLGQWHTVRTGNDSASLMGTWQVP